MAIKGYRFISFRHDKERSTLYPLIRTISFSIPVDANASHHYHTTAHYSHYHFHPPHHISTTTEQKKRVAGHLVSFVFEEAFRSRKSKPCRHLDIAVTTTAIPSTATSVGALDGVDACTTTSPAHNPEALFKISIVVNVRSSKDNSQEWQTPGRRWQPRKRKPCWPCTFHIRCEK